ncbi:MAG TPA: hypothetical protein VKP11_12090 [Frankiaceae bacterium]|nr:hypothetical protein [Frankiaceae bacterium]
MLLAKLALFAVLLALGWLGRRWIVRRFRPVVHAAVDTQVAAAAAAPPPGPEEVRTLRRRVGAEILLGAAVLLVPSVLVAAAPARSSYGPPFDTTVTAGPLTVRVNVPTTRRGPQTMDVSTSDGRGRAARVAEVSGELSLPTRRVGPIRVPFTSTGPGRATSSAVTAPLPGTWQLRLAVRVDDFTEYAATIPYRVH